MKTYCKYHSGGSVQAGWWAVMGNSDSGSLWGFPSISSVCRSVAFWRTHFDSMQGGHGGGKAELNENPPFFF